MKWFAGFLVGLTLLGSPGMVSACPLCKEAIEASDGEEEINNLPAAYNQSIYLMVSVPYVLLGGVGFLIYRGCKKNAAVRDQSAS